MKKFRIVKESFQNIKKCPGCALKKHRRNQVIGKGSIPATILFIGEAPGKSEDLLGEPFVGPSGNLLNRMIRDASDLAKCKPPSYFITNTVLCRPWIWDNSRDNYGSNREPKRSEILACKKNIIEIANIIEPEFVVFIGQVSFMYYSGEFKDNARITHPSAHLRFGGDYGGQTSPMYNTDIRTLSDLFRRFKC